MKTTNLNTKSSSNLFCTIIGHNFKISKHVTHHVKEYSCKRCKKELTTNGDGKIIELTPKFKEINSVLAYMHTKKMKLKNIQLSH